MAYATRDDAFMCLSAQGFVVRARPVGDSQGNTAANVNIATGTIRLKAHGLSALDLILFEAVSGGALPPELSAFTYYTPIVLGADLFKVATTQGGSTPIAPFTSAGSGWGVSIEPMRRLDWHLNETAGQIDECLTADTPPLLVDPITGRYPWQVIGLNARMAVLAACNSLQIENPEARKSLDRILEQAEKDEAMRDSWRKGKPINPRPTDQTSAVEQGALASAGISSDWSNNAGCGAL